jgi:hypothetical protein
MLHCAAGEAIGMTVAAGCATLLNHTLGEPQSLAGRLLVVAVMAIAGAIEGLSLGYFQWRVLRTRFPPPAGRAWVGATTAVAAGGWLLGMLPPALMGGAQGGAGLTASVTFLLAIVMGLGMGAALGAGQWLALRPYARRSAGWITANMLGWSIAMLWVFLGATLPEHDTPASAVLLLGAVCGAAAGMTLGLITGRWLPGLQPQA